MAGLPQVSQMYNWSNVATRTEAVYCAALSEPHSAALAHRLPRLLACGRIYGLLIVAFAALSAAWHAVVCRMDPEDGIERAAAFNTACCACIGEAGSPHEKQGGGSRVTEQKDAGARRRR